MTFFYDLNKRLASIAGAKQLNESVETAQEDIYMEKIEPPIKTDPAERGKYKGQGVADLKKQMASVKDRMAGYKERGEKVPAELRGKFSELTFAIRAKQAHGGKWGKIKETGQEDLEPWQRTMKEDDMEEGNEFSGELAKARATGAKSFKVDGKEYAVKEGAKPDFLDLDKDGNRKESMKKAARDAKLAKIDMAKEGIEDVPTYIRDKMGKPRLTPADLKRPGAYRFRVGEKEFMDRRAADEFAAGTGEKVQAIAEKTLWPGTPEYEKKFPKDMRTGEKKRSSTGGEIEKTATGVRHTAKAYDDEEDVKADDGAPKRRGRPKGKDKGPERVTAKAWKHKGGRVKEGMEDEEMIAVVDRGEYDREGDMAHDQLRTIEDAARELASIIDADDNLPEWVQSKITKAMDYIDTARDHLKSKEGGDQPVAEKAVSKAQQRFMGMAHAMQKGEKIPGASKELKQVARSMKKGDVKDFAKTKHKGLPEKVKKDESVKETADEAPKAAKKMGGIQFGKGVYEAMDEALEKVITESINISVNMSTDEMGQPRKNITVSAEGDDADKLAQLLSLAGIHGHQEQVDEVDENQPDWPTAEVESGEDPELRMYAGGLNKPKSSGQTVDAPPNLELRRNGFGVKESTDLGLNLYRELQQFKGR